MRRILIAALAAALLAPAAPAENCVNDILYFHCADADECGLEVQTYTPYSLEMVLLLDEHADPVDRVSFRVENYIGTGYNPNDAFVDLVWLLGNPEGNISTGMTVRFDPPLDPADGEFVLARIDMMSFQSWWPLDDTVMSLEDAEVFDIYEQRYYTTRGFFHFNPTDFTYCFLPGDYEIIDVHVESVSPPPGTTVTGDFILSFAALAWWCLMDEPSALHGQILVDGEFVHEFFGEGFGTFDFPIDISGCEQGQVLEVEIILTGEGDGNTATLLYPVQECTGALDTDLSTVKRLF